MPHELARIVDTSFFQISKLGMDNFNLDTSNLISSTPIAGALIHSSVHTSMHAPKAYWVTYTQVVCAHTNN